MDNKKTKLIHAFLDAFVNAVAIFSLTLGGLILTSNSIDSLSLEPALVTSGAVALIRFSLRLYQEDDVNLEGMGSLPGVPSVDNKNFFRPREVVHLLEIVTVKSA